MNIYVNATKSGVVSQFQFVTVFISKFRTLGQYCIKFSRMNLEVNQSFKFQKTEYHKQSLPS